MQGLGFLPYLDVEPSSRGKKQHLSFYEQSNFNHFCFIGIFIGFLLQEIQN